MILFRPKPHQELIYQKRKFRAKRPRNLPPCTTVAVQALVSQLCHRRRYCAAAAPYSRPWPWPLPRPRPRRLLLHASTSAFWGEMATTKTVCFVCAGDGGDGSGAAYKWRHGDSGPTLSDWNVFYCYFATETPLGLSRVSKDHKQPFQIGVHLFS